jgi:hypothetical protein
VAQIPALRKVRDLALQVDQCIRQNSVTPDVIQNIINYIRAIARAAEASRAQAAVPISHAAQTAASNQRSHGHSHGPGHGRTLPALSPPAAPKTVTPLTPRLKLQDQIKAALSVLATIDSQSVFKRPVRTLYLI